MFGAGVREDGGLTPMLADRMETAIALYRAGKVRKLLVSGDNRFVDYDEPTAMYNYAVARGVPAADVCAISRAGAPMTPATVRAPSSACRTRSW